jgi:hypothetical protein
MIMATAALEVRSDMGTSGEREAPAVYRVRQKRATDAA